MVYKLRNKAMDHNLLKTDEEENICSVCSSGPEKKEKEQLLVCSACPRAFCSYCMARLLKKPGEYDRIMGPDEDWDCPSCVIFGHASPVNQSRGGHNISSRLSKSSNNPVPPSIATSRVPTSSQKVLFICLCSLFFK
jgi:hypothetical protein